MGILSSGCDGVKQAESKRCKPDYEAQIKSARQQVAKVVNLKDAIFDFVGNYSHSDKLNEMVGELVFAERQLESRIAQLIKDQENDAD